MKRSWFPLVLLLFSACREADAPLSPSGGAGYLEIASDPAGASIFVDGKDRKKITPDTVHGLHGRHTIQVQMDSAGNRYSYSVQLDLNRDSIVRVDGPLMLARCAPSCAAGEQHTPHRMRFSRSASGPLFYTSGSNRGLVWPWSSGNSYSSNGLPVFGAQLGGTSPVALGVYDLTYLVGRPFPRTTVGSDWFSLRQSFWVLPPVHLMQQATVRGLEVQEEVIGRSSTNDVLIVRITFRNVTNQPSYKATDPYMPPDGMRMNRAYLGFAMDSDIGESGDDLFTYVPELDALVQYDARFSESGFAQGYNVKPGLVGLRLLDAPAGTKRVLNGWPSIVGGGLADWQAGTDGEAAGYDVLAGRVAHAPNHASETIGHLPGATAADYRLAVSAGPVDLAPGDSASITIAVAVAEPVAGTFTSGTAVESGDPTVPDRPITRIAAALLDKLRAATAIR